MNDTYRDAVSKGYELGRTQGIDAALLEHHLDALVLPADGELSLRIADRRQLSLMFCSEQCHPCSNSWLPGRNDPARIQVGRD